MSLADDVLELVSRKPGLTERELSLHLFGRGGVQQRVNPICRRLVSERRLERRGAGYSSDPFTYHPLSAQGAGNIVSSETRKALNPSRPPIAKPILTKGFLVDRGFKCCAAWKLVGGDILQADCPLPAERGVYAFSQNDIVQYVGVATKGIARRLYSYTRPGPTQITNIRLNSRIREELVNGQVLEILVATPSNFEWNGLPIDGVVGLEASLIDRYSVPWNVRGA